VVEWWNGAVSGWTMKFGGLIGGREVLMKGVLIHMFHGRVEAIAVLNLNSSHALGSKCS
jgi:hypothetical protein